MSDQIHDEEERDLIDMASADLRTMPLYRTAPERVGLAIGDELEDWNSEFGDCEEVTWFSGEPPVQVCIGYVRADHYDALRAQLSEAQARLATKRELLERLRFLCADLIPDDTADEVRGVIEIDDIIACLIDTTAAPAAPAAQAVDVADICNAYESGVRHRGRKTANINPYAEGTHEHEAYAIGAAGKPGAQAAAGDVADELLSFLVHSGFDIDNDEEQAIRAMLAAPAAQAVVDDHVRIGSVWVGEGGWSEPIADFRKLKENTSYEIYAVPTALAAHQQKGDK